MKRISVKKAILILSVLGITGISIVFVMARGNKDLYQYTTQKVSKGELVQTVSETGIIKTAKSFNLSFEQSGKIDKVFVQVGQKIEKDTLLAEIDHSSLDIKLLQARASLDIARANLSKLQSGATKEELAIYTANYDRAKANHDSSLIELEKFKTSLNENITQAEKSLFDLEDSGTENVTTYEQVLDSAVTNLENTITIYKKDIDNSIKTSLIGAEAQASSIASSLDKLNSILTDSDIENNLSVKNKAFLFNSKNSYDEAVLLLEKVNSSILLAKSSLNKDTAKSLLTETQNALNKTYLSLNNIFSALENSITSSTFTKAELDALKTIVNTQIGIVTAGITSIQASSQSLDNAILSYDTKVDAAKDSLAQAQANLDNAIITAKNNLINIKNNGDQQIASIQSRIDSAYSSLLVSKAELNKIKSPARNEDIYLYQAQLRQADSEVNSISNQIEKSKLKSPIAGTISKLNFEPGEQYIVGKPMATLISGNEYEIEVDISESDITKLKLGNKAIITLDAFNSDIKLYGTVSFIEPAETVIQEVIYYRVKIIFDSNNGNIDLVKPGMTANVDITTDKKENVIAIPGRAIIDRNGDGKFVKTYNNEILKEKKVEIGIVGDGGLIEIISGISEGDEVVTFTKEK